MPFFHEKGLIDAGDVTGFTDDETELSPEEEAKELEILSKEADMPLEDLVHPENVNMVTETINTGKIFFTKEFSLINE